MEENGRIPINHTTMVYKPALLHSLVTSYRFLQPNYNVCMFWYDTSKITHKKIFQQVLSAFILQLLGKETKVEREHNYFQILKYINDAKDIQEFKEGLGLATFTYKGCVECVNITKYISLDKTRVQFFKLSEVYPDFDPIDGPQKIIGAIKLYLGKLFPPVVKASKSTLPPTLSIGDRDIVIAQQQQRLVLLHHAKICASPLGQCPDTPRCAKMKEVWMHIQNCREKECPFPHCTSSRNVLSHFHRCRCTTCLVCPPVRDTIRTHQNARPSKFS
jgi:hypothetical protein